MDGWMSSFTLTPRLVETWSEVEVIVNLYVKNPPFVVAAAHLLAVGQALRSHSYRSRSRQNLTQDPNGFSL
jgi:hypothetical protein